MKWFLSASSGEARTSRDDFFSSLDFHELWYSVMTICLFTEAMQQWATLVLGWVTVRVLHLLWDVSELEFHFVARHS